MPTEQLYRERAIVASFVMIYILVLNTSTKDYLALVRMPWFVVLFAGRVWHSDVSVHSAGS